MRGFYVSFLFILAFYFPLQGQQWEWARNAGGANWDVAEAIAADKFGNVYVAGKFFGPSMTLGSITLNDYGQGDMFLAKYDKDGNVLWAKNAGGNDWDAAWAITIDDWGYVYVGGFTYSDSFAFGSNMLVNNSTPCELFLLKYDQSGNEIWGKNAFSTGFSVITGLAGNKHEGIYITGYFSNSLSIDGHSLQSKGGADIFVMKCDPLGNIAWAKGAGGNTWEQTTSIQRDKFGDVLICGFYDSDYLVLGQDTLYNPPPNTYSRFNNVFVAKMDSMGNIIWGKGARGMFKNDHDVGRNLSTDNSGNIYVTGTFGGWKLIFNDTDTLSTQGSGNMYLVKYDPAGNFLWAKCDKHGSYGTCGTSLAVEPGGDVYVGGTFGGYYTYFDTVKLTSPAAYDFFLVKYDNAGNALWGTSLGSGGVDNELPQIARDPQGNIFITGGFDGHNMIVGMDTLCNADTTGSTFDVFLAKLPKKKHTTNLQPVGATSSEAGSISQLNIYPNPSTGKFNILGVDRSAPMTIRVQNMLGESVSFGLKNNEIDLSGRPQGIYIVEIISDRKRIVNKIILE